MSPSRPQGIPAAGASWAWCIRFLGATLCIAVIFCWTNYKINLYGLFGNVRGMDRPVYLDEAQAKYLLSMNYVPSNFDGVLVGSSITDSWDTGRVRGLKLYNASITGGNISEEKLLADNILDRGRLRVMLICVWPYMTASHGRLEGGMEARQYWEGLGSLRLLYSYKEFLLIRARRRHVSHDRNGVGQWDNVDTPEKTEWRSHPKPFAPEEFPIDPVALQEYRDLVWKARQSGTLVVRLIPPVYYDKWLANRSNYAAYFQKMSELFNEQAEPLIDCNTPQFDEFRKNRANFLDGIHLSADACTRVSDYVATELERIMSERSFLQHASTPGPAGARSE